MVLQVPVALWHQPLLQALEVQIIWPYRKTIRSETLEAKRRNLVQEVLLVTMMATHTSALLVSTLITTTTAVLWIDQSPVHQHHHLFPSRL